MQSPEIIDRPLTCYFLPGDLCRSILSSERTHHSMAPALSLKLCTNQMTLWNKCSKILRQQSTKHRIACKSGLTGCIYHSSIWSTTWRWPLMLLSSRPCITPNSFPLDKKLRMRLSSNQRVYLQLLISAKTSKLLHVLHVPQCTFSSTSHIVSRRSLHMLLFLQTFPYWGNHPYILSEYLKDEFTAGCFINY